MKEQNPKRYIWLTIRLNETEDTTIKKLYNKSKSSSLSEYARDVLLQEPVIITYRNQSADDFLQEMIELKNELNAIGKNVNQAVHKLHTLDIEPQMRLWVAHQESTQIQLLKKTQEISEKLQQIHQLWLQK